MEKINFKWNGIVVPDDGEFVPMKSGMKVKGNLAKVIEDNSFSPAVEPPPSPTVQEPEPQTEKPEVRESVRPHIQSTVHMHCLPVEVTSHSDELYGDQFERNSYGQKFIFEAVMVEMGDLAMVFWTDTDRVIEKSIVYPFRTRVAKGKYKPLQQYRWWQVTEIEEKPPGYLMKAVASNTQPDFS